MKERKRERKEKERSGKEDGKKENWPSFLSFHRKEEPLLFMRIK
jgi:hypothetical protein